MFGKAPGQASIATPYLQDAHPGETTDDRRQDDERSGAGAAESGTGSDGREQSDRQQAQSPMPSRQDAEREKTVIRAGVMMRRPMVRRWSRSWPPKDWSPPACERTPIW